METIVLFYKYISITDVEGMKKWQQKICADLQLKGRIILASEGINATLAGEKNLIDRYISLMEKHPLFGGIDYKMSEGGRNHFPRLSVKVKAEIVKLGIPVDEVSALQGGKHLTPEQAHALIQQTPKDLVIFDARNQCEWEIGRFEGAQTANISYFRDLPAYINSHLDDFKDKQVLMYCTGGVRCERASAYLKQKNVAKEVYQLQGGIHRYIEQYPDGFFRGKNYVFDGRISVRSNSDILGVCLTCKTPCDMYTNCENTRCNKHYISCYICLKKLQGLCSEDCKILVEKFPHYVQYNRSQCVNL